VRDLPRALRWYLWTVYLVCVAVVVGQSAALATHTPSTLDLGAIALFALLIYAGERATVAVSGSIGLSLATPPHIAAILLFPPPIPALAALAAVVATQGAGGRVPLYKRAFNVCHPTLVVGLCGAAWSLLSTGGAAPRAGHILGSLPALLALMVLYYVLDVGAVVGVIAIERGQSLWDAWRQSSNRTLLPETATIAIGILAAAAWRSDRILLAFVVAPVIALRIAFRAISQAEEAQRAADGARLQAEEALRVRDAFLTAGSHDLRTPLTVLIGRVGLIQARLDGGSYADREWLQAQVSALQQASRRMAATVEEITDAAQLQMGQHLSLTVQALDIGEVVHSVARMVSEAGFHGGVASVVVDAAPGVIVEGDRMRLERVAQNIIGNAAKYSPMGAPVYVSVYRHDRWAIVTVRDQGIGIPAAELPHIFTRFYRASTARDIHGTGIGLAGAKAIVEQHRGRITVESAVGQGTTVVVSLPLVDATQEARQDGEPRGAGVEEPSPSPSRASTTLRPHTAPNAHPTRAALSEGTGSGYEAPAQERDTDATQGV